MFSLCTVFRKVISLIYGKSYFGDSVPLTKDNGNNDRMDVTRHP